MRKIFYSILVLSAVFLAPLTVLAWSNPSAAPTDGGAAITVVSGAPTSTLHITSSGNIGIGTINPGALFNVNGTLRAGGITVGGGGVDGDYAQIEANTGSTALSTLRFDQAAFRFWNPNAGEVLRITKSGAVGIGRVSPASTLDVNGIVTATGFSGTISSANVSSGSFGSATGGGNYYFPASIGIGTVAPAYKLDVSGSINGTQVCIAGVCQSSWPTGSLTGSGTVNYLTKWTAVSTLGNSSIYDNGVNVGIGVSSPSYKLDVASGGSTTARIGSASTDTVLIGGGTGKITVGTIDPVYNIDGEKYATYMTGMTGIKEETTKALQLTKKEDYFEGVIDFKNSKKGTDDWIFYQATDFGKDWNNLTILISKNFKGDVWYNKDLENKRVVIYSDSVDLVSDSEVSIRLTAPRFDHVNWTNFSKDETEGLKVESKK